MAGRNRRRSSLSEGPGTVPHVLEVRVADHVAPLVGALVELLVDAPPDPFASDWVAVPSIGMRRWLAQQLSLHLGASGHGRADGISANIEHPFPADLRRRVLDADAAALGLDHDPWAVERLVWSVMEVLVDPRTAADPVLGPVAQRSEGATLTGRASALADLVDRYVLHRPDMVRRWIGGDDVDAGGSDLAANQRWQPALVRALREAVGSPSAAERLDQVVERLRDDSLEVDLPERLVLFGMYTLPPDIGPLVDALSRSRDVHLLLLSPSVPMTEAVSRATGARRRTGSTWTAPPRHELGLLADVGHPLLRSWGAPSREAAALLGVARVDIHVTGAIGRQAELGDDAVAVPAPDTILGRLQADLRADRTLPGPSDASTMPPAVHHLLDGDRSIQVHSCTGSTRQVEVLRDAILHLLAADPDLTEGDVAVLCPRIEELSPVIQAVLGPSAESGVDGDGSAPALRYRIADRSTRTEVPLFGAVTALLELLPGRFGATEVADYLGLGPVRDRFGLSSEDLGRLDEWIEAANVRWGLDGPHRVRWGLPADFGANSWSMGLDRLLTSTAVRPDGPVLAVGDVAPMAIGDGSTAAAARVADAVRTLGVLREGSEESRTIEDWCAFLSDAVDRVCSLPPSESWQRRRLDRILAALVEHSEHSELAEQSELADGSANVVEGSSSAAADGGGGASVPRSSQVLLSLADLRRLLADRLQGDPARAAFGTGAVTFCSLAPLRSVPHPVVCILGLDQDSMPRGVHGGDDLLIAAPAVGDRDPRAEARQQLLEAVLAAQQTLVITCGGADVRTNASIPPAVVLDEMWDCLALTCGMSPDEVRSRLMTEHPRQAFDVSNFSSDGPGSVAGRPWSFDPAALDGATAILGRRPAEGPPVLLSEPLPTVLDRTGVRSLDQLVEFVRDPVGQFVQRRLGVRLPKVAEVPSDDLPIALDPLGTWRIGAALMGVDRDDAGGSMAALLRAAGDLPPGALGEKELDKLTQEVASFRDRARELGVHLEADRTVDVDAALPDGTVIRGAVVLHGAARSAGGDGDGPWVLRYSRPKPHHVLVLAVRLLVLTVADPSVLWRALSLHRASTPSAKVPTVHDLTVRGDDAAERSERAAAALTDLVEIWDTGMTIPLPLFDRTSHALAHGRRSVAALAWEGDHLPEGAEPATRLAFGERSFAELRTSRVLGGTPEDWARRLWSIVEDSVADASEEGP